MPLPFFLSDGNLKWDEEVSTGLPLLVLPAGDPKGIQGCSHQSVKAPAIAFRGREVSFDITVKSYGYAGLNLPVVLKEGNRVLTAKNVRLPESPAEATLSLSFTPEKVGQHILQISVPTQAGESISANNSPVFPLTL